MNTLCFVSFVGLVLLGCDGKSSSGARHQQAADAGASSENSGGAAGSDPGGCMPSIGSAPTWVLGSATQPVATDLTAANPTSSIRRLVPGACGDVFLHAITNGVADWAGQSIEGDATFLAHVEPNGSVDWLRSWTDGDTGVYGAAAMPDGALAVAGELRGPVDFGDGPRAGASADAFVATFDRTGGLLAFDQFGDEEAQWATALATNERGEVAIAATGYGKVGFGTGEATQPGWLIELDAGGAKHTVASGISEVQQLLALDSQGRITVAGGLSGPTDFGSGSIGVANDEFTEHAQFYLLSYETTGELRFTKAFREGSISQAVATSDGDIVLVGGVGAGGLDAGCGPTGTGATAFVASLDADGNCQWSQALSGTASALVAQDGSGGIVVGGRANGIVADSRGNLPGRGALYIERLSGMSGAPLQGKQLGVVEDGHVVNLSSVAATSTSIWLAGSFSGNLEIEGVTLRAATDRTETFLARIAF